MSEQPAAGGSGSPDPGATADLDSYVAANAGRFTDDVLYSTLVAAGHSADDVRSALASASARLRPRSAAPKAVRRILLSYGVVFALLSAGMLLNNRPLGYLMPTAEGGIQILAWSLGVTLVASLIWVASRRVFGVVVVAIVVAWGIIAYTTNGSLSVVGIVAVVVVGGVWLVRQPRRSGFGGEATLGLLLSIPTLMLLVVGGICLASGLPIPAAK